MKSNLTRKKIIKTTMILLVAPLIFMLPQISHADDDATQKVSQELCANGVAEGGYTLSIKNLGDYHINIVCVNASSLALSLRELGPQGVINTTLAQTAIDDDMMTFMAFHASGDDAKTMSPNNIDVRLKLSVSELKHGVMKGFYKTGLFLDWSVVSAKKESTFPQLLKEASPSANYKQAYISSFNVNIPTGPMVMTLDIVGGIQRINMNFPGVMTAALYNGLRASSAGNIFYATAGVDDGTFGKSNLYHVRGRILNANELEVYYLDSLTGMSGPFKAVRRR